MKTFDRIFKTPLGDVAKEIDSQKEEIERLRGALGTIVVEDSKQDRKVKKL